MTTICSPIRRCLLAVLASSAVIGLSGCHPVDFYRPPPTALSPEMDAPHERSLVSLPTYRIGPPDLIQIEMLKQIPLPPYRAETYDVLQIQVVGTLLDQPIADYYLVEAEGWVDLGAAYGKVYVAGMTIEEIKTAVTRHLTQVLVDPGVSVQLARASGTQPVTGEYLVSLDGTVNLRQYGRVFVAGMTIAEAAAALEEQLSKYFDSPEATINVIAYNSKVYYIVTEGANLGDNINRLPITGKETVLDALSQVGGLSQLSSKKIWIARPTPGDLAYEQILPVDYDAITRGAASATNYQILPGDRIFISQNNLVALSNFIAQVTGPFERIAGMASLAGSTLRNLQTLGRGYNQRRFN